MKTIILDTNGILRWLLNDIPSQADQVQNLINQAQKSQINLQIPQIVLFEIYFTLVKYYLQDREQAIRTLQQIVVSEYLQIAERQIFLTALDLHRTNATLSFVDCFLAAQSKVEKSEVFTFDKKLKKILS